MVLSPQGCGGLFFSHIALVTELLFLLLLYYSHHCWPNLSCCWQLSLKPILFHYSEFHRMLIEDHIGYVENEASELCVLYAYVHVCTCIRRPEMDWSVVTLRLFF